jgi:ribonuclease G
VFYLKEVYIERREKLLRIAIIEDGDLVNCFIEEKTSEPQRGEIYKGVVKNIVPGIKCAFIDIGYEKNCYMYVDRKFNNTKIKKNDEVIVEVLKESVGEKGPKVTNAISIPGRYAVLETLSKGINFSKKIQDEGFRCLINENIKKPEDVGITIRTNAERASLEAISKEIEELYEIYKSIKRDGQYSIKPKLLYSGDGLISKIIRDTIDDNTEKIIVDSIDDYNYLKKYVEFSNEMKCKVEHFIETRSLFSYYGIEKYILNLRSREVLLEDGGTIVIDKTEAMYVFDVNSGKNTKSNSMDKTAFETNIKAAREAGKQILLRNLSGIIIIDFIDMSNDEHKSKVMNELKHALEGDKSKTNIYPFTQLNIVQLSRERRGKSIYEYIQDECHCCKGRGTRIRLAYLVNLLKNEILKISNEYDYTNIFIELSSQYKQHIMNNIESFIQDIGACDKKIYMDFVEEMDLFKVEPLIFPNNIENMQKYKIYG